MIVYSALYDESILHFIGQWHMATEGARMRDELLAFRRLQQEQEEPGDLLSYRFNPRQHHGIPDYLPGVQYHPEQWDPTGAAPFPLFRLPGWPEDLGETFHLNGPRAEAHWPSLPNWSFPTLVQTIAPPGQVLLVAKQAIALADNDILDLVGGEIPQLDPRLDQRLVDLAERAEAIDPLDVLGMPHSASELGTIVTTAHEILSALTGDSPHVVALGPTLSGGFLNGEASEDAPLLDDLLPEPFLPNPDAEADPVSSIIKTQDEVGDASLTLQAGANMAMNAVVLSNLGLLGGVIAVAGDVYRIDAIIQSNAHSDTDHVDGQDIATDDNGTATYNYAAFAHVPMLYAAPVPEGELPEGGPENWAISVVDGDLIFAQWVVQTNFVHDNDIHVLTETGAYSNFVTGANLAHNFLDFSDLGKVYDLILIGGNLYDANIITQVNVLLDDDVIDIDGRPGDTGTSSGNLLYNGASITNMGAQNWLEGLPQHYLDALRGLASGNTSMPDGFADDPAFEGFDGISVLVVTGNVYDLRYISQTNVAGDADLVTSAEAAAVQEAADTGGDWDISTGENALINTAAILDTDSLGEVAYVGGQLYSDAVLIQSDILSGPSDEDPDALVYEAIAFLTADDCSNVFVADDGTTLVPTDSQSVDVLSSVLT